jgi:chemotaxis protein histidine kinase CheA
MTEPTTPPSIEPPPLRDPEPELTAEAPPPKPPPPVGRTRRRLITAFVVACVLHLPFTPVLPLFRTLRTVAAIKDEKKDWDYDDKADLSVPIELLEPPKAKSDEGADAFTVPTDVKRDPAAKTAERAGAPDPEKAAEAKAAQARAEQAAEAKAAQEKAEKAAQAEKDKKADEAAKALKDKEADQAKPEVKFAQAEGGPEKPEDAAEASLAGKKSDKDDPTVKPDGDKPTDKRVVGLSGKLNDKIVGKPNVTLAVWFSQLRDTPAEALVAPLFACNAEWRWFADRGVTPLRDLDGVMMTGPQLSDSSKLTVAVQHRLKSSEVQTVVTSLVAASGPRGTFLEDDVARIVFQHKDRVVFPHQTQMVFVAPPVGWETIRGMKGPLSLPPADGRAFSLTLQNPSRPLKKLGLRMSDKLTEMKLDVFANPDGGADVQIDFEAATAESAAVEAKGVNEVFAQSIADVAQLAQVAKAPGALGAQAQAALTFPTPSFDAVDKRITGTMHFAPAEAQGLLGLVSKLVCAKRKPAPAPKAPAKK